MSMRITFKSKGFRQILFSPDLKELVKNIGDGIASAANSNAGLADGFTSTVWDGNYGGGRVVASVTSQTRKADIAEADDKALTKAVHA